MTDRAEDRDLEGKELHEEPEAALHTEDLREATSGGTTPGTGDTDDRDVPLLGDDDDLRQRWEAIQAGFVDEPRRAVEQADGLVAEVIKELVDTFSAERSRLEDQWGGGGDVSTEDLRISLQRYRSFFNRLLEA